jgi:UDP:flavonoid glycosyltransferase YjiC (YdhE family)
MRITILTVGTDGDVLPYIALGVGLQAAGHTVRIATHNYFETQIKGRGLDFSPVRNNPRDILTSELGQQWLKTGRNPIAFMRQLMKIARPRVSQMFSDLYTACEDTELILFHPLTILAVIAIKEKYNILACPANLQHTHPTRDYPNVLAMPPVYLGSIYNRLSYPIGEEFFWQFVRSLVNQWRIQALDLPPLSLKSPFAWFRKQHQLCLYGFSSYVLPKPSEWGDEIHVTGYWFLDRFADWQPPDSLVDFLGSGSPPIYVGFGSITDGNPEELTEIVFKALAQSRQRGLLLTGWRGLTNTDLPDDVFKIETAPHDWLFPQMATVVHHGGAGTTAAGLRAGIPTIVVPFFADQPFWAWRVNQLGVGPKPIPRKSLSARRLAAAINEATSNTEIKRRATLLGQQIRAEDGVIQAVNVLNQFITRC